MGLETSGKGLRNKGMGRVSFSQESLLTRFKNAHKGFSRYHFNIDELIATQLPLGCFGFCAGEAGRGAGAM